MRGALFAFQFGRFLVFVPVFLAGLGLWAWSAVQNAWNYTEVEAEVERVETVCVPSGSRVTPDAMTPCPGTSRELRRQQLVRRTAVYVAYTSPADNQLHRGIVAPVGGQKAVEAGRLQRGQRWRILAHDDEPEEVKAE